MLNPSIDVVSPGDTFINGRTVAEVLEVGPTVIRQRIPDRLLLVMTSILSPDGVKIDNLRSLWHGDLRMEEEA